MSISPSPKDGKMDGGLLAMLELALPYVQNIAATSPTEYNRMVRQRQAVKDAAAIRAAIHRARSTGEADAV